MPQTLSIWFQDADYRWVKEVRPIGKIGDKHQNIRGFEGTFGLLKHTFEIQHLGLEFQKRIRQETQPTAVRRNKRQASRFAAAPATQIGACGSRSD